MSRRVKVFHNVRVSGSAMWERQLKGPAIFHQFGVDYEEFESGAGNYSTAIVEYADGTVEGVPLHHIQFCDPEGGAA